MSQTVLLLILYLLLKGFYKPLNKRQAKHYWGTHVDMHMPLIPLFVLPYLSFLPLILVSIVFVWNTPFIDLFLGSLSIAYIVAILIWYFVPNGVKRPEIVDIGFSHRLLSYLYKTDHDTNGFPSAHVFVSLICAYYVSLAYPSYQLISWGAGILVAVSTIFTKQHYVIDIIGGILVFIFSVGILKI